MHRKLGIKPESRVLLSAVPVGFELDHVPHDAVVHTRAAGSSYDVIVAFTPDRKRLNQRFEPLADRLTTCATTTIVALTGRNASPALTGLKPFTIWMYCVKK